MTPALYSKDGAIDWNEIHDRLRRSASLLDEAMSPTPERIEAVFRRRALQLAREDRAGRHETQGLPALIVRAAGESYAIALHHLAEVVPFRGCTPVPGAAPEFRGVVNLRGEMCPVIELGRFLTGREHAAAEGGSGVVLFLRPTAFQVGLRVDIIEGFREIELQEIDSRPAATASRYVSRMVSGALALLDIEAILAALVVRKDSHPL
jgi:chemotaxis signal transduction protein